MSERKLDQIENMFKKTQAPRLEIDEISRPKKFGVLLDDTKQGRTAVALATEMSGRLDIPLDIVISEEYYDNMHLLLEGMKKEIEDLKAYAAEELANSDTYGKTDVILASRVEKVLELFDQEMDESGMLGERLVRKLAELESTIFFMGVPVFRSREENDAENLGGYATKLLREQRIHSNFMLVTEDTRTEFKNSILSFVSIEQQPGSIVALTRRALSLSNEKTDIFTVGMIEDKVVETVARVDQIGSEEYDDEGNEILDLDNAEERLNQKMEETLASIRINDELSKKSFSYEVKDGTITGIVSAVLDEREPGLVLVRSVADISENLDPIAEQISRIVLRAGYPCLIVWD